MIFKTNIFREDRSQETGPPRARRKAGDRSQRKMKRILPRMVRRVHHSEQSRGTCTDSHSFKTAQVRVNTRLNFISAASMFSVAKNNGGKL